MSLVRNEAKVLTTHLPDKSSDPGVAYSGVTPWTGPWRILAVSATREGLSATAIVRALQ